MAQKNGWGRVALAATAVVAIGGAATVLGKYTPWAPRITLSIAADNSLARLDSQVFTLIVLQDAAKKQGDQAQVQRLEQQIKEKQRQIDSMKALKKEHK